MTDTALSNSRWSKNFDNFLLNLRSKTKRKPSAHDLLVEAESNSSSALEFVKMANPEILGDDYVNKLALQWKMSVCCHVLNHGN